MGDELDNRLAGHAVGKRALEVPGELVAPGHRGQRRHGDEAPVALRETGPFPDIAVQDALAELDELRRDLPDLAAGSGCGRRCAQRRLLSLRVIGLVTAASRANPHGSSLLTRRR